MFKQAEVALVVKSALENTRVTWARTVAMLGAENGQP